MTLEDSEYCFAQNVQGGGGGKGQCHRIKVEAEIDWKMNSTSRIMKLEDSISGRF